MRKNLHHKIMLSILAGSLALGFVYAPPAFAEDVLIADTSYTAPDGTRGTYDLDADVTNPGTNYNNTSITLPTGPIGTFTVIAGNGGNIEISAAGGIYTGGNGGNVTLTFNETVTGIINATGGNGGNIKNSATGGIYTGGNGGNVTLTFKETVTGNINATGGKGGSIEISAYGGNLTGGNGGNATLTFNDIVVTDNISLTSGTNGTRNGANSTPGNGGSVTFEAESIKALTADSQLWIIFNKNDGDIKFTANTLAVQNGTVIIAGSCTPADGSNNHINTLLLTGSGNIDVSDNIKIGSLTIDGGTIINNGVAHNSWQSIIERDYNTTNTITIGTKGATFDIHDNLTNTLTKSVTGAGNLIKTGEGTLILDEENGNNTYDYTGLTVVEKGTLDASASALTASKGLTLLGDTIFKANSTQNWNRKQIAVYDNGSDKSATYQGNLNAQYSNLYFIASGDNTNPLLSVTGSADISGSKYNIGFTGKTTFDEGQTLTLIEADGTIDASGLQQGNDIDGIDDIKIGSTITQSITDVTTVPEVASNGSKLIATLGSTLAADEASVLNASMLGGLAFNLQGADLIAREGMEAAVRSAQLDNNHAVFAALTRSGLDYGAVDVDGTNMLAGLAWRSTTGAGSMTYGFFAEHGDGSYDTYANINGTSLHGEGDTDYTGGGILARMDFNGSENGHGYLEASGRVGNADTDYTNSGLRDAYGRAASYSTDGTYYGAHIGAGYVQKLDEKSSIDWYGKLLWARLEGGSASLSTGEHLTFDDADSLRLRIGGRWNYAASDFINYYAGLGYEYEFDGKASGFTNGLALGDEDLTGGSGVAELGISFKPSKNSPFSLELNLAGFTGEREGFRGGVEAVYTF